MSEKQESIISYLKKGLSQREIYRRTGIARDTIRKYIRAYGSKLKSLGYSLSNIERKQRLA